MRIVKTVSGDEDYFSRLTGKKWDIEESYLSSVQSYGMGALGYGGVAKLRNGKFLLVSAAAAWDGIYRRSHKVVNQERLKHFMKEHRKAKESSVRDIERLQTIIDEIIGIEGCKRSTDGER